jgi:flagellar hook assembly protein FlgD
MIFYSGPTEIKGKKNTKSGFTVTMCNGMVKVAFAADITGSAHITIFDLSGRLMRVLDFETGIGRQAITWDGVDNSGKGVSNGCYIIRVEYDNKLIANRFMLNR